MNLAHVSGYGTHHKKQEESGLAHHRMGGQLTHLMLD